MEGVRPLRLFRAVCALALSLLAFAASAAVYNSHFDPANPASFVGDALFQFDNNCLSEDGTYTAGACHLRMLSAHVDITNDGTGGTGHLDFGPDTADMINLIISGGTLVGINTDLIGSVFAAPCSGSACGVPWWIAWNASNRALTGPSANLDNSVLLFTGFCDDGCIPDAQPTGVAPTVTFTLVSIPEPATLALLLAALVAGCLPLRRPRG